MRRKNSKPQRKPAAQYSEAEYYHPKKRTKISEAQTEYVRSNGMVPPLFPAAHNALKPLRSSRRDIAGVPASDEVWQFVAKNKLIPHLEKAIRLVYACYPSIKTIQLDYEIDWEIESESWIAINIQVPGNVDTILEQYLHFNREMIQQIPARAGSMILLGISGLGNKQRS